MIIGKKKFNKAIKDEQNAERKARERQRERDFEGILRQINRRMRETFDDLDGRLKVLEGSRPEKDIPRPSTGTKPAGGVKNEDNNEKAGKASIYIVELGEKAPFAAIVEEHYLDKLDLCLYATRKFTGVPDWVNDKIQQNGIDFVTGLIRGGTIKLYAVRGALIEAEARRITTD